MTWNVVITDFDSTMTDYVVSGMAAIVCWKIFHLNTNKRCLQASVYFCFFFLGLSTLLGGTSHGFFTSLDGKDWTNNYAIVWRPSLISLLLSSFCISMISYMLVLYTVTQSSVSHRLNFLSSSLAAVVVYSLLLGQLVGFSALILYKNDSFISGAVNYLISGVSLALSVMLYWKDGRRDQNTKTLIWAILFLFAGILAQVTHLSIHDIYFTHNAVFHCIQTIGFILFYQGMKGILEDESWQIQSMPLKSVEQRVKQAGDFVMRKSLIGGKSYFRTVDDYFRDVMPL